MKKTILIFAMSLGLFSCDGEKFLKNQTETRGYAMGEKVELRFVTDQTDGAPDTIRVFVVEKKTEFRYSLLAEKDNCDNVCEYKAVWDGRKPDGSWPAGGIYLVYGVLGDDNGVYSDTVQIGLGD